MAVVRVAECQVCHSPFVYAQVSAVRLKCEECRRSGLVVAQEPTEVASIEIVEAGPLDSFRPEATWAYQFRCPDGEVVRVRWRRWESPLEVAAVLACLFPRKTPTIRRNEGGTA